MRVFMVLLATLLIAVGLAVTSQGDRTQPQDAGTTSNGAPLVVHEWGTFTSFSGSDSIKLEFRPLVDADLPAFVLDRARQAGAISLATKKNYRVLQRMETPVTYFYTDQPRQVTVRVGFPQGLLTEFFPPVAAMQPAFEGTKAEALGNSRLGWGPVWLIPEDRLRPEVTPPPLAERLGQQVLESLLPATQGQDHYAFARQTDSALVYVERPGDAKRPLAPRGAFFEKFLFYRGIGNFELPLQLTALGGGRFELDNLGSDPICGLFLVTVDDGKICFSQYDAVEAGGRLALVQSLVPSSLEQLSEAVVEALVGQQLYAKEARAMVNTWSSSWFGEDGTRLFYMLPRALTDELLPLEIDPEPSELVRVMVGRMEIMTPEDESHVSALVAASLLDRQVAAERAEQNPQGNAQAYGLPESITELGRLAEPALVRVMHLGGNAAVRQEADRLLRELQAFRDATADAR